MTLIIFRTGESKEEVGRNDGPMLRGGQVGRE